MTQDNDTIVVDLVPQPAILTDDRYLVEMSERIQKLRSLTGEKVIQSKRRKRWAE